MEYNVVKGKYRGQDVWEVRKGSGNTALVMDVYKNEQAAKDLMITLISLSPHKARD